MTREDFEAAWVREHTYDFDTKENMQYYGMVDFYWWKGEMEKQAKEAAAAISRALFDPDATYASAWAAAADFTKSKLVDE